MTRARTPEERQQHDDHESPAVQRSWARWQYARNERLGLDTPPWVVDLAELESDPLLLAILAKGRWRHPRGLLGRWGDRRWRLLPRRRPRIGTGTARGVVSRPTAR